MIPKSGHRFSEKIMLKTKAKAKYRITLKSFRFSAVDPAEQGMDGDRAREKDFWTAAKGVAPIRETRALGWMRNPAHPGLCRGI
jgi:hypothetical protein